MVKVTPTNPTNSNYDKPANPRSLTQTTSHTSTKMQMSAIMEFPYMYAEREQISGQISGEAAENETRTYGMRESYLELH